MIIRIFKFILRKMKSLLFPRQLIEFLTSLHITYIRYLDGNYGNKKRYNYYKKHLKFLGKGVIIDTGVFITGGEFIWI